MSDAKNYNICHCAKALNDLSPREWVWVTDNGIQEGALKPFHSEVLTGGSNSWGDETQPPAPDNSTHTCIRQRFSTTATKPTPEQAPTSPAV